MSKTEHFILFDKLPLIYGRVPKVANTSIKATLSSYFNNPPRKGYDQPVMLSGLNRPMEKHH